MSTMVTRPYGTEELDRLTEVLRSALVSDILDGLGHRGQSLTPGLVPVTPGQVVVGYAYLTEVEDVDAMPEVPYVGLLAALDGIAENEVWMIASASDAALWGELTSTSIRARGARGSVCDGMMRDTALVRELDFPVFARGTSPRDCAGRVEIRPAQGPIVVGGVLVHSGDLVVGDDDGVVVIPAELVVPVVDAALAKNADESLFRAAVRDGMKPSDAFREFGVL